MRALKCREQATVQIFFGKKQSRLRTVLDPLANDVDRYLLKTAPDQRHSAAKSRGSFEFLDEEAVVGVAGDYPNDRVAVGTGHADKASVTETVVEPQSLDGRRAGVASGNGAGRSKNVGLYRSERRLERGSLRRRRIAAASRSTGGQGQQERRRRDLRTNRVRHGSNEEVVRCGLIGMLRPRV